MLQQLVHMENMNSFISSPLKNTTIKPGMVVNLHALTLFDR